MLEIKNLSKTYVSKKKVKCHALKSANAKFNKGEIVSIFGPSGSGKTTLLNAIGGFDSFDKGGKLIVEGVSTDKFSQVKWDNYRNYKVGYVFQEYNLIEQHTVLENVVIALAFSHIKVPMRVKLAKKALKEVGLEKQMKKYPNELSGGQMQCVAIARAIVKNPDIILADEPTGSLDTKTSTHIMDVLKKVSKNRLLIVATHNEKLAKSYSTIIYQLEDGVLSSGHVIKSNSNDDKTAKVSTAKDTSSTKILKDNDVSIKKSGLSFSAAFNMGFSSLRNKKAKSICMLLAGSVGVFLVATILSISNGLNIYVDDAQNTTLAQYPITFELKRDLSKVDSYVKAQQTIQEQQEQEYKTKSEQREQVLNQAKQDKRVALNNTLGSLMSTSGESTTNSKSSTVNDLGSLKKYFETNPDDLNDKVLDIEYSGRTSPVIYSSNSNGIQELYPSNSMFGSLGSGSGKTTITGSSYKASSSSAFSFGKLFDIFGPLPKNSDLYKDEESLVAGHWPENPYECLLVLNENGTIDDTMLYYMGMRNFQEEIAPLMDKYMNNEKVDFPGQFETFAYNEFLGNTFKVINPSDAYVYNDKEGVWEDYSWNTLFMTNVLNNAKELKICGVVLPRDGSRAQAYLNPGFQYPYELNEISINMTKDSGVVQAQLNNPNVDVLSGETFDYLLRSKNVFNRLGNSKLVCFDLDMLISSIKINPEALDLRLPEKKAEEFKPTEEELIKMMIEALEDPYVQELIYDITKAGTFDERLYQLTAQATEKYLEYYLDFIEKHSLDDPETPEEWFADYDEDGGGWIIEEMCEELPQDLIHDAVEFIKKYGPAVIEAFVEQFAAEIEDILDTIITAILDDSGPAFIEFDVNKFSQAIGINVTLDDVHQMCLNITGASDHTYKGNLADFGYDDMSDPIGIAIYPKDFQSKQDVVKIIDNYNEEMKNTDQEAKFVTYSDNAGTLVNMAQGVIAIISGIIVFFVSSVFVTSTLLIGVIFGISTVQRRREIGILRALGARRRDVARMFNCESFLIGALSGILGVVLSLLIGLVLNALLNVGYTVAVLPLGLAIFMIVFSAALILIAGLIPAKIASKKDPVKAIRGL